MHLELGDNESFYILYSRAPMDIDDLHFSGVCLGAKLRSLPHVGRIQLV